MGKYVHVMSDADPEKRMATCANCGRVRVVWNGRRWVCSNKKKQYVKHAPIGPCEICGTVAKLVRDHDHRCCSRPNRARCGNCERGLLCGGCNSALGFAKDDPVILLRAAEYLITR